MSRMTGDHARSGTLVVRLYEDTELVVDLGGGEEVVVCPPPEVCPVLVAVRAPRRLRVHWRERTHPGGRG